MKLKILPVDVYARSGPVTDIDSVKVFNQDEKIQYSQCDSWGKTSMGKESDVGIDNDASSIC